MGVLCAFEKYLNEYPLLKADGAMACTSMGKHVLLEEGMWLAKPSAAIAACFHLVF